MPRKIDTSFLKEHETILMILHRHWIILVFKSLYLLILIVSTLVLIAIQEPIITLIGSGLFWALLSLYWIAFIACIFLSWVNDELDLLLITNERVIGVEQITPLSRTVSECSLDRVQEVNSLVAGVFPSIFWYGEVHVYTASEMSNMIVKYAPNPVENVRKINTIIQELKNQKNNNTV